MNGKFQSVSYVKYLDKVFMEYVSNDFQGKSQVWNISHCHVYGLTLDGVWIGDRIY
jgi:hypothetical protein